MRVGGKRRGGVAVVALVASGLIGPVGAAAAQDMNNTLLGGALGAGGGAVLGRLIAGKHNNTAGLLGGALLGGVAGGVYGRSQDQKKAAASQQDEYQRQATAQRQQISRQVEQRQLVDQYQGSKGGGGSGQGINLPNQVMSAQRMLSALKIYAGPTDGLLGPQTRSAVTRFQADSNLPQTGDVTPALLDHLRASM